MEIITLVALLIGLTYFSLLYHATIKWQKLQADKLKSLDTPVSILVIARNEAAHIEACLRSISSNSYPKDKYEIILVDDHSDDGTAQLATKLDIQNLNILSLKDYDTKSFGSAYKKAGQYYGVKEAKFEMILQTDADCICPSDWIVAMMSQAKEQDVVTGPIHIDGENNFISKWQAYDNIGTMLLTHLGIVKELWYSANGANMLFRKEVYLTYAKKANYKNASGDDVFLINWAAGNNYRTHYSNHRKALVATGAVEDYQGLYKQRLRWATKTKNYGNNGLQKLMAGLFLFHFVALAFIISFPFSYELFMAGAILYTFKVLGDIYLLKKVSREFGVNYNVFLAPIYSAAHLLYVVLIGLSGIFVKKYRWKNREVA